MELLALALVPTLRSVGWRWSMATFVAPTGATTITSARLPTAPFASLLTRGLTGKVARLAAFRTAIGAALFARRRRLLAPR